MHLNHHRFAKLAFLAVMYLAQGLPWGFVSIALTGYMYEQGLSAEDVGAMLAMAMLPWPFKWVLGPIIDRWTILSMGRRRPWILFAQVCMVLSTLTILSMPDLTSSLKMLGAVLLFHNCFVALQDVSVDALAVDILEGGEREKANSVMYAATLIGTFIGSAGLGYIAGSHDLHAALWILVLMQGVIIMFPLLMRERAGEKLLPWTKGKASEAVLSNENSNIRQLAMRIFRAFTLRATLLGVLLALFSLVGSMMTVLIFQKYVIQDVLPVVFETPSSPEMSQSLDEGTIPESLVTLLLAEGYEATGKTEITRNPSQAGVSSPEWQILFGNSRVVIRDTGEDFTILQGWTQASYSISNGSTVISAVLGSLLGGFLGSLFGVRKVAGFSTVALGLTWIVYAFILTPQMSTTAVVVYMHIDQLFTGIFTVALWALFMQISWPVVAATQFTAYMAMLNVSRIIGSEFVGASETYLSAADWATNASQKFGIGPVSLVLFLAGIIQIAVALIIAAIDPSQTRRVLGEIDDTQGETA
jgi:PAT family beta-lactamase induction signal transducer AmpG